MKYEDRAVLDQYPVRTNYLHLITGIVYGQAKSPKRGICGDASPQDLVILAPSVYLVLRLGSRTSRRVAGQLSGIEWVPMAWNACPRLTPGRL